MHILWSFAAKVDRKSIEIIAVNVACKKKNYAYIQTHTRIPLIFTLYKDSKCLFLFILIKFLQSLEIRAANVKSFKYKIKERRLCLTNAKGITTTKKARKKFSWKRSPRNSLKFSRKSSRKKMAAFSKNVTFSYFTYTCIYYNIKYVYQPTLEYTRRHFLNKLGVVENLDSISYSDEIEIQTQ